jgi:hypothetical protein
VSRRSASRLATLITAACASGTVILLSAASAAADAASPYVPGEPVGVPYGPLKDVFIEHENLSIDLTGVGALPPYTGTDDRTAIIDARYTLRNDGAAQGVDLVFVTASVAVPRSQVLFDGSPVESSTGPLGLVPASWMPPHATPTLAGGSDLPYLVTQPVAITFHVAMGAGRHTMETRYSAMPGQQSGNGGNGDPRFWQVAFVLSPARQWGGFGDLNVSVRVPGGWEAAVYPALSRVGDLLTGHFQGVPADAIAITTRLPIPTDWTAAGWVGGSVLLLALAVAVGRWLGWRIGWWSLLTAPLFAIPLAWVVSIAASARNNAIPPGQESWFGSKGTGLLVLLEVVLALGAGFVIGATGLAIGRVSQLWSSSRTHRSSQ